MLNPGHRGALAGFLLLLASALANGAAAGSIFGAYHESWSEAPVTDARDTRLARLPGYLDVVFLAFARPDGEYDGDLDLGRTGLQFPFDGRVVENAVAKLRQRAPHVRVLLSIGGATYQGWGSLRAKPLARVVKDLGLDGVDIDFEPHDPACADEDGTIRCASDGLLVTSVAELREALPRPFMLAVSGWSIGAFGEGRWRDERPRGRYTGMSLALLRSPTAADIDLVNVMAYDAGAALNPLHALAAYRDVFPGPVLLGISVHDDTVDAALDRTGSVRLERVRTLSQAVAGGDGAHTSGLTLYSLQMPSPADASGHTMAAAIAAAICRGLRRSGCADPLP